MRNGPAAVLLLVLAIALQTLNAQSRISELNDAGWKALRDNNPRRAAALFAEGLSASPDDPVLLFGAGAAAHALGRQSEAMARLERALELQPRLTAAARLP